MKKVALVTGSSRGIGRAVAAQLAREGYAVCINYYERRDKAEELVAELRAEGCEVIAVQADVSDRTAVNRMVETCEKELGQITLLVNNAGLAGISLFQDVTEEAWDRFFDVNLKGCRNTIWAVMPKMIRDKCGCIVNMSSIWGLHGASCEVTYCCTKHAIIGLTRALAMELAPSGIRVNCVAPGVIDTDMSKILGEETLRELAQQTPLGRIGTPEDIAEAVCFFASDKASFITGQVLTADGGFMP
ncbi:MAG: SDR family oxidoreductase [Oscillospiraceae bacterium]|nr:SDR family oxidoreductase [Oscillospiraceae bacterium]